MRQHRVQRAAQQVQERNREGTLARTHARTKRKPCGPNSHKCCAQQPRQTQRAHRKANVRRQTRSVLACRSREWPRSCRAA
eukprot:2900870-Pleurochrysis_carterae.AAC.1